MSEELLKASKIVLTFLSIWLLALSLNVPIIGADPSTVVYVDPPTVTASTGENFNVDVDIANITDLYAWQFRLSWNETAIKFIDITEGPILATQPQGTFFVADTNQTAHPGNLGAAATTLGNYTGVNGSGTLASLTFQVKEYGETIFHLYDTILVDSQFHPGPPTSENEIAHVSIDGYFSEVHLAEYAGLLQKYDDLLAEFDALNSTYYSLLSEYNELIDDYGVLLTNYESLQDTWNTLLSNYNQSQDSYNSLNSDYGDLEDDYDELKSKYEASSGDLDTARNLNYLFVATTVIFIATTAYLVLRKPQVKPQ